MTIRVVHGGVSRLPGRSIVIAIMAALAVLASGCSSGGHKNSQAPAAPSAQSAAKVKAAPVKVKAAPVGPVKITPAN